MNVEIINKSDNELPEYKTIQSAGMDLRAYLDETAVLTPFERKIIKTGLFISLPTGYEAQIRPRSGLFIKNGISANFGTIDSDYRGEILVLLINLSNNNFIIERGMRIAQIVFNKIERVKLEASMELDSTLRGEKGFGSTGTK